MRLPELGNKGEGWLWLQVAAFAAVPAVGLAGPGWPAQASCVRIALAVVVLVLGALLGLAGLLGLGRSLSVFPEPPKDGSLVTTGLYGRARHPVYGGVILMGLGVALVLSPWALAVVATLAMVLWGKSVVEERRLERRFPEYPDYRRRVPRRFLPL